MNLQELKRAVEASDPPVMQELNLRHVRVARDGVTTPKFSIEGAAVGGGHVVVIDNDGIAEYAILYPDGHLGAVED